MSTLIRWAREGVRGLICAGHRYAEMDKEEKNKISHRGKALAKLKAWLAENHR